MGFWDTNTITPENMNLLGPLVDGIVGTNGEFQDLYEAMIDPGGPGWNHVIVTVGCTMSQDVTIPNSKGACSIIGLETVVDIGSKKLTIEADDCLLFGIRIDNTTGDCLEISGQRCHVVGCHFLYVGAKGIYLSGGDYHVIDRCTIYDAGDDGVAIVDGVIAWLTTNRIQACDAWGVDDDNAGDNVIYIANFITGNTSGNLSTNASATYKIANVIS